MSKAKKVLNNDYRIVINSATAFSNKIPTGK